MKLNEINDLEFLKNELKRFMIKCKEDITIENLEGKHTDYNAGEYYYISQDEDSAYVYDFQENIGEYLSFDIIEQYFEIEQ